MPYRPPSWNANQFLECRDVNNKIDNALATG